MSDRPSGKPDQKPTRVQGAEPPASAGTGHFAGPDEATRLAPSAAAPEAADPDATLYGDAPDPPTPAPDRLTAGTVLFGEYEIIDVIGAGGMGAVYRARHRRLNDTRAIKVMHPAVADDPTAAEFFLREAKALLSVQHPAVVNCHDLLSDDQGRVYLVMEMIDGVALSDRLRNAPLSEAEVRTLGARVASGLAAAHARGVIHRDLSPDNIVLPGGRPEEAKLIDFGIAKVLETGQQTLMDGFKGKLAFASPEQLGFFEGRIDGRSDIYALGLVLYAAATGHLLPMGESFVDAVDARRNLTALPSDTPESLRGELSRMLAFDPEKRPRTADGLFTRVGPLRRPAARSPGWLPWTAGAGAAVLSLGAAALLLLRPAADAPVPETPPALDAAEAGAAGVVASPLEPPLEPPTAKAPAPAPAPTEEPVAAPKPKPKPNRSAVLRERLRVVGLLRGAEAALERNELVSPPGANAYDKYREVLSLDADNADAKAGIQTVGGRLIAQAQAALGRGSLEEARTLLDQAQRVSPRHPDLAAARSAVAAASGS